MKPAILLLALALRAFAALSITTVWEVRPTNGLDTNGGGFDAGVGSPGTDFSQQNAVQVAYTDLVVGATTTQVTSAASPFGSTYPGNLIHIASGAGCTTGWFEVVSVAGVTATLDRSAGTAASTCTASLGGALQTLTQLNTNMALTTGVNAWIKAESIITTSAGFTFSYGGTGASNHGSAVQGYTSTRGDGGYLTVQASASTSGSALINVSSASGSTFRNFIIDCNSKANTAGINAQGTAVVTLENVLAKTCSSSGGVTFNNSGHVCRFCLVTGQSSGAGFLLTQSNGPNYCQFCAAIAGTVTGFNLGSGSCYQCISANNTGASSDCFSSTGDSGQAVGLLFSIAYKCGRDGLRINGADTVTVISSVFYGNTGVGLNNITAGSPLAYTLNYNAVGGNGTARTNVTAGANDVTLTADPYTSGGSNIFTMNSAAGGGALLVGAGFPGLFSVGGVSVGLGNADIGTLQHSSGGGGGGGSGSTWTPLLPE